MQQHFKIYKSIDTAYAAKILFSLQENEKIQSVKVCPATNELTVETDKPFTTEEFKNMLDAIPDLIIEKQE